MQNRLSRTSKSDEAAIRLLLLGPMQVRVGDRQPDLSARKARALLAYLALRPGVAVPRETLAGLLWGDRGEEQARASLRQTLSAIRKALGAEAAASVIASQESVTLEPDNVWVDVQALQDEANSSDTANLMAIATLYRGELLEGLNLNEPSFDQWLTTERERARLLVCRLLSDLVELLENDQRIEEAIAHGARLLALDPLQEHVHRTLMRLYSAQGRYDVALNQFEQCRRELSDHLDVAPEQATLDLLTTVKARRRNTAGENSQLGKVASKPKAAKPSTKPAQTLPDKPSIAVLPFSNLSGDPEQEYFSDGITEDIITELSRYQSLFVTARNSSFVFRDNAVDVREVGRALGIRYVLEGSVRKAGNRVRVTAQLVEAATTDHIWADRYDRELADVFELQDDISRTIVSTIAGRLDEFQAKRAALKPIANLSAYESVLRGQKFMHKYTREDYAKARGLFEQAISLDGKLARAYGWLACVEIYDWFWHITPGGPDHAIRIGEQALALDDQSSKSHLALGVAYLFRSEHNKAEHHLFKAASLHPNDDLVMIETGRYLLYVEQPMEGAECVRQAMRRNPYHPNWYWNILGRCFHTAKAYQDAVHAFERIDTPQFWNHAYLAACYTELGRTQQAAHHKNEVLSLKPDFTISAFALALPYRDDRTLREFLEGLHRAGLPK